MVKLIGALLVFLAATVFGFYQALLYSRRPIQIRQLILSLQRLETEIMYGFTPLPEAIHKIGRQASIPLTTVYTKISDQLLAKSGKTMKDIWQAIIQSEWKKTAMKEPEKEVLLQLGFTLGLTDRDDQVKHLRLAIQQLHEEESTAVEDKKRYEKMWKSLGVLAGALIVLLMY